MSFCEVCEWICYTIFFVVFLPLIISCLSCIIVGYCFHILIYEVGEKMENSKKKEKVEKKRMRIENEKREKLQNENEELERIQRENEEIVRTQRENEEIERIQRENEEIERIQRENEEIERIQRENEEREKIQRENKEIENESNATAIREKEERNVLEVLNELSDQIVVVKDQLKTNEKLEDQEKLLDAILRLQVKHATIRAEETERKELEENKAKNAYVNTIRALEKEKECKICMDKEVGVVFIPCGHIACCVECGESFSHCPICRSEIELKNSIFTG